MSSGIRTVDVSAIINDRRLSSFNYRLIVLSWFITVFDGFDMMTVSFTAPYMRDEFGLSTTMLGYVFSSGLLGMMLGGILFAFIADQIGRRPTVLVAAAGFGLLTTATGFASSYHALLALRFLDGLAIGGMLPMAWALNIEFVPVRFRATIVTLIMMGYSFGTAVAGPMTNVIAPRHGWQAVYWAGGAGTLLCTVALWIWLPESIRFLIAKGLKPRLVVDTLRRMDGGSDVTTSDRFVLSDEPATAEHSRFTDLFAGRLAVITPLLWVAYTASSMAIYFSSSWGPIVLESLNVARPTAALTASLAGLLGAGAGLALMRFTDRLGPRALLAYPVFAIPVLLIQGFGITPVGLFLAGNVLGSMLVGGTHFGLTSIAGVFYPSAIRASGGGWTASVAKIGGILGPIVGATMLTGGFPIIRVYAMLAVCPFVVLVCVLGIQAALRGRRPPINVPAGGSILHGPPLRESRGPHT